jgi:hypothetical protein
MSGTNAVSHNIPAGTYWVGDPCYAYSDDALWMALLESADYKESDLLEARARGHRFVASGTAFGDGTYEDGQGREYPVDAGLIGVVPAVPGQECPGLMHEVEFTEEFTVSYEDGTIYIGPIAIETDPVTICDGLMCRNEIDEGTDYCWECADDEEEE